nr:hypothetical protein [Tanacetum cinerariifolium]
MWASRRRTGSICGSSTARCLAKKAGCTTPKTAWYFGRAWCAPGPCPPPGWPKSAGGGGLVGGRRQPPATAPVAAAAGGGLAGSLAGGGRGQLGLCGAGAAAAAAHGAR